MELTAGDDDAGRRLDRILRKALPDHSLSLIHRLLRQGKVLVNGIAAGANERIQPGMVIRINSIPCVNRNPIIVNNIIGRPSLLPDIIWRGAGIIVFNKPSGLSSHGPNSLDTMVNTWLAGQLPHSLSFKPGPLHRLDRPTSGIIAFSETLDGARLFSRLLSEHKITKTYLAIVEGCVSHHEVWQDELLRDTNMKKTFAVSEPGLCTRNALTEITPLACNGSHTLIEAYIKTGRTHQIRAQAAFHGYPLAGDLKYGGHRSAGRSAAGKFSDSFFLHAWKMEMKENPEHIPLLTAPPPLSFLHCLTTEFGKNAESICR